MYVSELRSHLLSGLFQENPDDLEVYGEVYSNKIKLVVLNKAENKQFDRSVSLDDFTQYTDRTAEGSGHPDDVQDFQPDPSMQLPGPGSVLEDNPLMPRLQVTPKVSEEEFLNKVDLDTLREKVASKVGDLSKAFVKEFLQVKADKAVGR